MYSVITISDTCAAGTATDTSGPHLTTLIKQAFDTETVNYLLIADEEELIKKSLIYACDVLKVRAIFTTGGTGFAPRDVTPEATRAVLTKEAPQLSLAMTLRSLEKTKFAVLSRAVCGVRDRTLIVNFPGSKKAVSECFESIVDVLPHVFNLLNEGEIEAVRETHRKVQKDGEVRASSGHHVCPHATGKGGDDRNSPYPMIAASEALKKILQHTPASTNPPKKQLSRINIPPFRASIKDGYAVKANGGKGVKKVIGYVSAGDSIITSNFTIDECYKINTGGPLPSFADAVVQIEDTKLVSREGDYEKLVEILSEPSPNLDIRPIGSDLRIAEEVFQYRFPLEATQRALLAAVGEKPSVEKLKVAILSTGDELLHPYDTDATVEQANQEGKIYDSNTTMLVELIRKFGFSDDQCEIQQRVVKDDFDSLVEVIQSLTGEMHIIICTGGVSMGDKDFVKPALQKLDYKLVFGRVNIKPGKPCVFASSCKTQFFGLPGNPVSAFVTFHLFALPALRQYLGTINQTPTQSAKRTLPIINVELLDEKYDLDPRPEYARASIVSRNGKLMASITGGQISSRLKSTIEADALLELPARSDDRPSIKAGTILKAHILRFDFISSYE
ncbi:molybdenum cofactor synthesis protein cinnamon [Anopheles ziemanni]|uniref:molybdenum cofactor synthesis protein cinnamon n=1 Tax=Anopheles coustani TaxID=139045 RepID=UPI00265B6109|nr:molybdenum cofactor synthesis protein cinnamon [Anopheles coustani]XP_058172125.1 molybdenum cofactor synthesis protein cinnamon [Anopheles ziemanni]